MLPGDLFNSKRIAMVDNNVKKLISIVIFFDLKTKNEYKLYLAQITPIIKTKTQFMFTNLGTNEFNKI